jgi:hypothetical protein
MISEPRLAMVVTVSDKMKKYYDVGDYEILSRVDKSR